jgi:hypothetical protein
LDIIHRLVFCLKRRPVYISKHDVSETGFYLRPQVKPTQLGPTDRASPRLQECNNCNLPLSQNFRYVPFCLQGRRVFTMATSPLSLKFTYTASQKTSPHYEDRPANRCSHTQRVKKSRTLLSTTAASSGLPPLYSLTATCNSAQRRTSR